MARILALMLASLVPSTVTTTALAQTANQGDTKQAIETPFYSPDEYQLAHRMFDSIRNHLYRAQTSAYPSSAGDKARFDTARNNLWRLERNWDQGRYDSRQISDAISAIQRVLRDNRLIPYERDVLGRDVSRLMNFQSTYY